MDGFKYWKRVNDGDRCVFFMHIGCNTSPHNNVVEYLDNLMNIPYHIDKVINAQSLEEKQKNRLRLTATIESIRWLTLQACVFRGHDESPSSNNRENFIEMINFLGKMKKSIEDIVLEKVPENAKYTSPDIQKDVLNIISNQVRAKIRKEIRDAKFWILVDEARDASNKEQMAIVLRFVDTEGFLQERFFAIVHVTDTTAATLEKEISDALGRYDLHIHNMRGQGYDGARNMRGSWNGLQALFLKDCSCAYYVHYFAHRFQLALTAATEKEVSIWLFFSKLNSIYNLINASPKRHSELHSAQRIEFAYMVATGERDTGRGCNQIGNLLRPGKTRWSSNFNSLCSMIDMYSSVIIVLENMVNDGASNSICGEASGALIVMKSFDFIFILHLMHKIMGITNLLCRALQEKSLDILSAMDYVSTTKTLLRTLREERFDLLLSHVKEVCVKYDIEIPHMEACYKSGTDHSCQQNDSITVEHHYRFDVFTVAIDFQVEELNNRFNDETVDLLKLSCALEHKENFKLLSVDHIYRLAEKFYYLDFDSQDLHQLRMQLDHYKLDVAGHERLQNLSTIFELCRRLIETNKSRTYDLIERLIRLVLTLSVSTATTKRVFSAMKLVKTTIRNKMEAEFFEDTMYGTEPAPDNFESWLRPWTQLTPKLEEILRKTLDASSVLIANPITAHEFQVGLDKTNMDVVNIAQLTCSCKKFDILEIPCGHALVVVISRVISIYSLCSEYYRTKCWRISYAEPIHPIDNQIDWLIPEEVQGWVILPPCVRRSCGRPRTRRIRSTGEIPCMRHCSTRDSTGHNKKNCKNSAMILT